MDTPSRAMPTSSPPRLLCRVRHSVKSMFRIAESLLLPAPTRAKHCSWRDSFHLRREMPPQARQDFDNSFCILPLCFTCGTTAARPPARRTDETEGRAWLVLTSTEILDSGLPLLRLRSVGVHLGHPGIVVAPWRLDSIYSGITAPGSRGAPHLPARVGRRKIGPSGRSGAF